MNRCPFTGTHAIHDRCTDECQLYIEETESCAIPQFMDTRNDILQSIAESSKELNGIMLNIAGTLVNMLVSIKKGNKK